MRTLPSGALDVFCVIWIAALWAPSIRFPMTEMSLPASIWIESLWLGVPFHSGSCS